jgi:hypothetical protein
MEVGLIQGNDWGGGFYNLIQNKNKSLKMKDLHPAFLTLFLKNYSDLLSIDHQ